MVISGPLIVAAILLGSADNVVTAGGSSFSLQDFLARGPAVVAFWNSWLPEGNNFAKLLPEIEKAAEQYRWPGVVLVRQERRLDVARRIPSGRGALPRVLDNRGELLRRFRVARAPAVLFVENTGQIRAQCGSDPAKVCTLIGKMAKR
jgi:hypothetical protein